MSQGTVLPKAGETSAIKPYLHVPRTVIAKIDDDAVPRSMRPLLTYIAGIAWMRRKEPWFWATACYWARGMGVSIARARAAMRYAKAIGIIEQNGLTAHYRSSMIETCHAGMYDHIEAEDFRHLVQTLPPTALWVGLREMARHRRFGVQVFVPDTATLSVLYGLNRSSAHDVRSALRGTGLFNGPYRSLPNDWEPESLREAEAAKLKPAASTDAFCAFVARDAELQDVVDLFPANMDQLVRKWFSRPTEPIDSIFHGCSPRLIRRLEARLFICRDLYMDRTAMHAAPAPAVAAESEMVQQILPAPMARLLRKLLSKVPGRKESVAGLEAQIAWAATAGSFRHTPLLKSIHAGVKLVRQGRWFMPRGYDSGCVLRFDDGSLGIAGFST